MSLETASRPESLPPAAFAVHLQLRDARNDERILPVIASANYFTLMRGESKEVTLDFAGDDELAKHAQVQVYPFNGTKVRRDKKGQLGVLILELT